MRGIGGGGGRPNDLFELFRRMVNQPSTQHEKLFLNRYRSLNPQSAIFGGGGPASGSGGGGALISAAGALTGAAASLNAAAARLSAVAAIAGVSRPGGGGGGAGGGRACGAGGFSGGSGGGQLARAMGSGRFLGGAGVGLALRALGPVGIAAGLGYEAIHLPQQLASLENSALGSAMPWISLSRSTFARGMAGRFPGGELRGRLAPGVTVEPPWMRMLGVMPQEAADSLEQYGIAPRGGAAGHMRVAQLLAGYSASPAFANVGLTRTIGAARLGAGYGQEPSGFLKSIAGVMEDANVKSLDSSKVLSSIEDILQKMASGGAPSLAMGGITGFFDRMTRSGLPGGMTGELQQSAAGSLADVAKSFGSDPLATSIAMRGGLRDAMTNTAAFRKLMGPQAFDAAMKQPGGKKMFDDMQSFARQGAWAPASKIAGQFLQGNPDAMMRMMIGGAGKGGPSLLTPMIVAGATKLDLSTIYGYMNAPPGGPGAGTGTAGMMRGLDMLSGTPGSYGFSGDTDYASALKRAGVPAGAIPDLVRAGKTAGVDPVMIAAYWHAEHSDFGMGGSGKARGPMGIMGGPTDRYSSFLAGGKLIGKYMKREGGDVDRARADYAFGPDQAEWKSWFQNSGATAVTDFVRRAYGVNVPVDENRARADIGGQLSTGGAQFEFEKIVNNLQYVNAGAHAAGSALERLADIIRKLPTPRVNSDAKGRDQQRRIQQPAPQP
jgi:hypothetical protein